MPLTSSERQLQDDGLLTFDDGGRGHNHRGWFVSKHQLEQMALHRETIMESLPTYNEMRNQNELQVLAEARGEIGSIYEEQVAVVSDEPEKAIADLRASFDDPDYRVPQYRGRNTLTLRQRFKQEFKDSRLFARRDEENSFRDGRSILKQVKDRVLYSYHLKRDMMDLKHHSATGLDFGGGGLRHKIAIRKADRQYKREIEQLREQYRNGGPQHSISEDVQKVSLATRLRSAMGTSKPERLPKRPLRTAAVFALAGIGMATLAGSTLSKADTPERTEAQSSAAPDVTNIPTESATPDQLAEQKWEDSVLARRATRALKDETKVVVESGDSLWGLGANYLTNIEVEAATIGKTALINTVKNEIAQINDLTDASVIYPGEVIVLPSVAVVEDLIEQQIVS